MLTTFENQLTKDEIKQGLMAYLMKKLWYIPALVVVAGFAGLAALGEGIVYGAGMSLLMGIAGSMLLYTVLRTQFSPDKTAFYRLHDNRLQVTGADGTQHSYAYASTSVIDAGGVLLLCFPKRSFAIVPKRNLNEEQIRFLSSLHQK